MNELLLAQVPAAVYTVPWFGAINFTPYIVALGVFIVLTGLFWLIRTVVLSKLVGWSKNTKNGTDDVLVAAIEKVHVIVYTIIALYVSFQLISLPDSISFALQASFYAVVTWQIIAIVSAVIKQITHAKVVKDESGEVDPNAATAADMVALLTKITLWILGGLFVLSNLGIEITSLVAGLGIGGIAVAFALQGILTDLFASFSLYFDKPFRVGDFIILGADSGTVEKIGIKSTRIRTLQGEELVVSNNELTTARVQNFKKMQERRIVSSFGIVYETKPELVRAVPDMVKEIFSTIERVRLDRVHFTTFGDSALQFEVVYFVTSSNYTTYLNAQQVFNLALLQKFNDEEIVFAYPTQMLYTKSV